MSALDLNVAGDLYCPTCEKSYANGERCPSDNTRLVRLSQRRDQLIGRELDGRYTITDKIGEGGMGTVYRGKQHSVGREVAIKVVSPSLVREPIAIKRFLREAKLASRLAHPNAVAVLDFGQTDDGLFFLVMELVTGRTLDKVLEDDGALTPSRVVRIGAQICDALEGAHALEIVHRDLKPANVMIIATGRDLVKVLDFGLAKSLSAAEVQSNKTTNAGALLGTPAYMPPELVSGGAVDGRADLYSLGCMLYQAASGRLPFWSESVHDLVTMHVSERPPKLTGLPRRLAQVIEKLLAKNPADRFASAAMAREALENAVHMLPDTLDESPGFGSTILGWSGRSRTDTIKSITPPPGAVLGTPPADDVTDPSATPVPRTPPNASVAWEGVMTPTPGEYADSLGGGTDTVRADAFAAGLDLKNTPIPRAANKPMPAARGSAPITNAQAANAVAPKVIRIVRVDTGDDDSEDEPARPQRPKTLPDRVAKPAPKPASTGSTLQVRIVPARRKLLIAGLVAGAVLLLGLVAVFAFGGGSSDEKRIEPAPAPPTAPPPTATAPAPAPPATAPPPAPSLAPATKVTTPAPGKAATTKPATPDAAPAKAATTKPAPFAATDAPVKAAPNLAATDAPAKAATKPAAADAPAKAATKPAPSATTDAAKPAATDGAQKPAPPTDTTAPPTPPRAQDPSPSVESPSTNPAPGM